MAMCIGMALVGMMILLSVGFAEARVIKLTPGWEAIAQTNDFIRYPNGIFFPVKTLNGTTIKSPNSTFALGLFSADFAVVYKLIICMLPFNASEAIEVWNVGIFTGENTHVLRVSGDGSELQYLDTDEKVLWAIKGGVGGMEMEETGNLLVYDSRGGVLWESFEHPNDVWLPGQALKQGSVWLRATNSSYTAPYAFKVEPCGAVLYSMASDPPQPYWVWAQDGVTSNYTRVMQQCGQGNLTLTFVLSSNGSLRVDFARPGYLFSSYAYGNPVTPYHIYLARLAPDGNFRQFYWNGSDFLLNALVYAQSELCNLPDPCNPYGVCSDSDSNVACSCPLDHVGSSLQSQFQHAFSSKNCEPSTPVACDARSMQKQQFLSLANVTYFSNRYLASLNWSSREDCLSSCLSNCSCLVAFYEDSINPANRSCFHVSANITSLKLVSSPDSSKNYSAYLKIQLSSSKHSSLSRTWIIVIVVASVMAVMAVILFVGIFRFICLRSPAKDAEDDLLSTVPGVPHRFTLKELQIATNGFRFKLGEGGFGAVFAGILSDGRNVAVKKLEGARQGQKELEAEVRTLGGISHVNLVRLYGFCIEKSDQLLVYEFMPNGSLDKWLFSDDPLKILSWRTRLNIAIDTAQGLAYLHEGCSDPVLHLDIKPQNILLAENFKAKVSDFGMAKMIDEEMGCCGSTQICGTIGYVAPEWPRDLKLTKKCDVYSFGIVLLELVSGRKVLQFDSIYSTGICYLPSWAKSKVRSGDMEAIIDPNLNKDFEGNEMERAIRLACWCIQENADLRPTMPQVIEILQGKMEAPEPSLTEARPILYPNLTEFHQSISAPIPNGSYIRYGSNLKTTPS